MSTFFYDEQIRRYILQFLRIFSDFSIELPADENGVVAQKRVPIVYGDMSRMVAQILRNNDQNTSMTAPMFSGYITSVDMAANRRQDPTNVNPVRVLERTFNNDTGLYESTLGNRYTVERHMPVPVDFTMNLDLWTTNMTDKLQLWEQLMVIFNPSIQLQTNDNPLDWGSITEVELTNINWSSRGVPQGTDISNDYSTFTFKMTGWISPPAKVKRQSIIEQVVTSVYNLNISDIDTDVFNPIGGLFDELEQFIVTPGNYRIDVSAISSTTSRVELLNEFGQSDTTLAWENLFATYGNINPETTTLTLKTEDDIEETFGDILGSLEVSDTEQNIATFVIDADTLPTTIGSGPVNDIINPSISFPGGTLPAAAVGQRYLLLTNDQNYDGEQLIAQTGNGLNPWGDIVAYENDIIEYNGTNWFVSFDSSTISISQYVVNIADSQHYRFDGEQWVYTFLATYNPGYWRVGTSASATNVDSVLADTNTEVTSSSGGSGITSEIYDEQVRRYILQFIRIFADLKIELPPDDDNTRVQKRVPIIYGDMSRMVAQILRNNDQNTSMTAPMFSGYITGVDLDATRRQDPFNVNTVRAIERTFNNDTGLYEETQGNRYTVERHMPVPYTLTMNLDLWTTNSTDKLQLWEQILVLFNPSIQLQTNDNPLDWGSITEIELTSMNWSSRGVPQGTDISNDYSTFTFKVPVWISPPAKVKRQSIIEQVVMSIYDVDISDIDTDAFDSIRSIFSELDQLIVTPGNYRIDVSAIDSTTSRIELLDEFGQSDTTLAWVNLFAAYANIDPETTTLILKSNNDIESTNGDILGSLEVSATEQNIAIFTVDADTLPTTIGSGPVNDLIDPSVNYPGDGTLPASGVGQRYLLLTNNQNYEDESLIAQTGNGLNPWGDIVAYENDIIEYNGTNWFVSFDSSEISALQYVVNIADSQHYRFDGKQWVFTYLATFNPGYWRVLLTTEVPPIQIGEIT